MFSIFTTERVVDSLVESFDSPNCSWLDILKIQKDIYYSGRDYNWTEDPEDPWFIVSQCGPDFINKSEYIDDIKNHPERVLENPDSAFILDIDENLAKSIEKQFGVVCLSSSQLDTVCKLSNDSIYWSLSKEEIEDTDSQVIPRKSWKDILTDMADDPSNAMILIDRNFFVNYNKEKQELVGVDSLVHLLDIVLPKSLKCEYQVLIVYEYGQHSRFSVNSYSVKSYYSDESDFIIKTEKHINSLLKFLRSYTVKAQLLSVKRPDNEYFSHEHSSIFNSTHDRNIITNYFRIGATYSLSPFYEGSGIRGEGQDIHRYYIYSDYKKIAYRDLPLKKKENIIKVMKKLTDNLNFFLSSGQIENRLIL